MSDTKAGRELDVLVAERVMGWIWVPWRDHFQHAGEYIGDEWYGAVKRDDKVLRTGAFGPGGPPGKFCGPPPPYSTSIADAWPVVEQLCKSGVEVQIHVDLLGTHVAVIDGEAVLADVRAKETPYAICLAALAAHGVKYE